MSDELLRLYLGAVACLFSMGCFIAAAFMSYLNWQSEKEFRRFMNEYSKGVMSGGWDRK